MPCRRQISGAVYIQHCHSAVHVKWLSFDSKLQMWTKCIIYYTLLPFLRPWGSSNGWDKLTFNSANLCVERMVENRDAKYTNCCNSVTWLLGQNRFIRISTIPSKYKNRSCCIYIYIYIVHKKILKQAMPFIYIYTNLWNLWYLMSLFSSFKFNIREVPVFLSSEKNIWKVFKPILFTSDDNTYLS